MNLQEHIRIVLKEEIISLKDNPVKYYYYNYLNEEPIEFKGLYLVPKWTGERIEWKVKTAFNPKKKLKFHHFKMRRIVFYVLKPKIISIVMHRIFYNFNAIAYGKNICIW